MIVVFGVVGLLIGSFLNVVIARVPERRSLWWPSSACPECGAVLYYAGDLADAGYVVQEGSFLLEPDRPGTGEEITVERGTLLGELGLITDTIHTATATAQQSSVVIRITRTMFLKMLEGYPEAARKLRDAMAQRVSDWGRDIGAVKEKLEAGLKKD